MYIKSINYDRTTRDYAMHLDGELVGFASTYHDAENELDALVSNKMAHGAIPDEPVPDDAPGSDDENGVPQAHAKLYDGMPEGTIINVCELSRDDARLVSANIIDVAHALGHTGNELEAAHEGDTWYINADLTRRFQSLLGN